MATFSNDSNELDKFKEEIDLVAFAINKFDYKPVRDIIYRQEYKQIELVDPSGDTIAVRRNRNNHQFIYINVHNSTDRGSIIDFLKNRTGDSLGHIRKACRDFLGIQAPEKNSLGFQLRIDTPPARSEMVKEFFKLDGLHKNSIAYLQKRGIDLETLLHPSLDGKIGSRQVEFCQFAIADGVAPDNILNYYFSKEEKDALLRFEPVLVRGLSVHSSQLNKDLSFSSLVKITKDASAIGFISLLDSNVVKALKEQFAIDQRFKAFSYYNTAFPITNERGIVGIEQKNELYRGTVAGSDKANGVWVSNLSTLSKGPTFFLSEAPIDSISYLQVQKLIGNNIDNLGLIATNGQLSNGQVSEIARLIEAYRPKEFLLGFDLDRAGIKFDISFQGSVPLTAIYDITGREPDITNISYKADTIGDRYHKFVRIEVDIVAPSQAILDTRLSELNQKLEAVNASIADKRGEPLPLDLEMIPSVSAFSTKVVFSLPYEAEALSLVRNSLAKFRGVDDYFKICKAIDITRDISKSFSHIALNKEGLPKDINDFLTKNKDSLQAVREPSNHDISVSR